jgi:glycerol-3-phosphate O-acyltransferase
MTETIHIPLWLVVICGALATWAFLDHLMLPSVRWFLRRRANILMKKINECLDLELPPFKLTKRRILIDRLICDTRIIEAAKAYSREHDVPNEVAMEKVQRFAREIVPSFNAYFYFRIGNWLNKSLARSLYRVRIGFTDENGLAKMDPHSSIVFIMNHRSNTLQ